MLSKEGLKSDTVKQFYKFWRRLFDNVCYILSTKVSHPNIETIKMRLKSKYRDRLIFVTYVTLCQTLFFLKKCRNIIWNILFCIPVIFTGADRKIQNKLAMMDL